MTEQKTPSNSRLQFTDEERASPELEKHIKKSDKAADRLDTKNAALPKKKKLARERTFDEATGKAKTRLHFEEQDKPPNYSTGKRKTSLFRPVTQAELYVHGKIHEVEKDNSAIADTIKGFVEDYNKLIEEVYKYLDEEPDDDYYFLVMSFDSVQKISDIWYGK